MKYCVIIFFALCLFGAIGAAPNPEITDSLFVKKMADVKNHRLISHAVRQDSSENITTDWTESIYREAFSPRVGLFLTLRETRSGADISVKIFELDDANKAFGLYCLERVPSLGYRDVGFEGYFWQNAFITWYGKYVLVLKIIDDLPAAEDHLREVARQIVRFLPEQQNGTLLVKALPGKDKIKYSEKLIPFRWLGQPYFENTFYADYKINDGYCRIFIIDNQTTSRADSNYWRYYDFIQKNASIISGEFRVRTDYYLVNEPLWGKIILAKKNQIIYGILNYKDREWTEDRMEDILSYLRKNKIVKSG